MENQTEYKAKISSIISDIDSDSVSEKNSCQYLDMLENYECWQPLFRLLEKRIKNKKTSSIEDFTRLARVHSIYLEDINHSAAICVRLIKDKDVSYPAFRRDVLPELVAEEDFLRESVILDAIQGLFHSQRETIDCLERLCLLYEKKKYNEARLNQSYESLLKIDPENTKALRFFKAVYTQNQEWEKVIAILEKLYENSKHVNDAFRIAQELATVYLFQQDEPSECLDVLEKYCQDSPLDTSSLYYEASYRLRDWQGCLEVLKSYLVKPESDTQKAIIYLKMGELYELLEQLDSAIHSYKKSFDCKTNFLEPMENLVEIHIEQKNWPKVIESLERLKIKVDRLPSKERIDEVIARIRAGLQE